MMQSLDQRGSRVLVGLLAVAKASIIVISVVMVVVTLAQVVFRYVLATPLPWSEELSRYCFVWVVFLGGAVGLSRGIHLGVDLFVKLLPERLQFVLELLVHTMIAGFALIVIDASIPVLQLDLLQRSPGLNLQLTWVYIAIPISMALIALISIERLVACLRSGNRRGI